MLLVHPVEKYFPKFQECFVVFVKLNPAPILSWIKKAKPPVSYSLDGSLYLFAGK